MAGARTKTRFIAQVMSGDYAVRKAEDIGEQELSYAEVKVVASGKPPVPALAETDAELQRLAILPKNHHDGQYLARLSIKRLPDRIKSSTRCIDSLDADVVTLKAHENDRVTVGDRAVANADGVQALTARLGRLQGQVSETCTVPMGVPRGLVLGIVLHPMGGPEAYLDGEVTRRTELRGGGRALLNALDRLASGYGLERGRCEQDKAVAKGQLADYQSRLGGAFAHDDDQRELTDPRDKLKAGLSDGEPKGCQPTAAELAEQIKAMRASNTVEAAPARPGSQSAARAERPVTVRISERAEEKPESQAVRAPDPAKAAEVVPVRPPAPEAPPHAQRATQRRTGGGGTQLSLF